MHVPYTAKFCRVFILFACIAVYLHVAGSLCKKYQIEHTEHTDCSKTKVTGVSYLTVCFPTPAEIEELMKVSDVAPLVAFLSHDSCSDNGCVFETAGGWSAKGKSTTTTVLLA